MRNGSNKTVRVRNPPLCLRCAQQALGETFGADREAQQGALRGRLKRLSTLGLPASGPGKGARRRYSWEQANQLLIALLMEDAGLDPVVVCAPSRRCGRRWRVRWRRRPAIRRLPAIRCSSRCNFRLCPDHLQGRSPVRGAVDRCHAAH